MVTSNAPWVRDAKSCAAVSDGEEIAAHPDRWSSGRAAERHQLARFAVVAQAVVERGDPRECRRCERFGGRRVTGVQHDADRRAHVRLLKLEACETGCGRAREHRTGEKEGGAGPPRVRSHPRPLSASEASRPLPRRVSAEAPTETRKRRGPCYVSGDVPGIGTGGTGTLPNVICFGAQVSFDCSACSHVTALPV